MKQWETKQHRTPHEQAARFIVRRGSEEYTIPGGSYPVVFADRGQADRVATQLNADQSKKMDGDR